jgi:hypothetical protein
MHGQRVPFKRPVLNLQARVNVFSALVGKRGCSARSVFISHMMDSWLKWYLQDRSNRASKHLDMENFMASAFIPWSNRESKALGGRKAKLLAVGKQSSWR